MKSGQLTNLTASNVTFITCKRTLRGHVDDSAVLAESANAQAQAEF